jgi:hypothetical protein
MASCGQAEKHLPQLIHRFWIISAFPVLMSMASTGQESTQTPHPAQRSFRTQGIQTTPDFYMTDPKTLPAIY